MRAALHTVAIAALLAMAQAKGQTPYPDLTLQDLTWTEGTHHIGVTQKILSPSTPDLPVAISGTADAEFVSGTQVRLRPGFHASDFQLNNGQFHAYINESLGPVGDVIIISPDLNGNDPYGGIADNVIHVHKWEKVEVGLRLPQEYQDAIGRFFQRYYSNGTSQYATPDQVDAAHDLNPYADDTLQLVMTLTRPDGSQTLKWGFFMREAEWVSNSPTAVLTEDPTNPLHPYSIRFRFAPETEGPWQFSISVKAPYVATLFDAPLPELAYSGYALVSEPPLPDNNGPLSVHPNGRNLWFEGNPDDLFDNTPFFGLGTNMSDKRSNGAWNNPNTYSFLQSDFDIMLQSMEDLHSVGGNFMRVFLMPHLFAPEWVNTGVYDSYRSELGCNYSVPDVVVLGNGQFNSWAFDRLLDQARATKLYIQLCIDPFPPIVAYEADKWRNHPYYLRFLRPYRQQPPDDPYEMEEMFYTHVNGVRQYDSGVFYYWKRRYKYIMARWGYSMNLPIIEPFNEIDQTLTYSTVATTDNCPDNNITWNADTDLPATISDWVSDIATYVRGPASHFNPVASPLGESKKLFLMSYAGGSPTEMGHHFPFLNPDIDLIDAHRAPQNAWDLRDYIEHAEQYRVNFAIDGQKKPFHHGEFTSYGNFKNPPPPATPVFEYDDSYKIFDNYDVSFHNELWASTFGGCFAAGTSWAWERVFWWPNALAQPPIDPNRPDGNITHTSGLGDPNTLFLGLDLNSDPIFLEVENRTLQHHFAPLNNFLSKPSIQALGLFTGNFTPRIVEANGIECFYLINEDQDLAVGWVHNANAYWDKAVYITNQHQRYLACTTPSAQSIDIGGFEQGTEVFITYFPTRVEMTEVPSDAEDTVEEDGLVTLNLAPALFNGIFPQTGPYVNHLDTLHSDYAFVVATWSVKSLAHIAAMDSAVATPDWDFNLYPNPARNEFFLRFQNDAPKSVALHDLSGRIVRSWSNVTGMLKHIVVDGLSNGAYWVRVTNGANSKSKKLLIH